MYLSSNRKLVSSIQFSHLRRGVSHWRKFASVDPFTLCHANSYTVPNLSKLLTIKNLFK